MFGFGIKRPISLRLRACPRCKQHALYFTNPLEGIVGCKACGWSVDLLNEFDKYETVDDDVEKRIKIGQNK